MGIQLSGASHKTIFQASAKKKPRASLSQQRTSNPAWLSIPCSEFPWTPKHATEQGYIRRNPGEEDKKNKHSCVAQAKKLEKITKCFTTVLA